MKSQEKKKGVPQTNNNSVNKSKCGKELKDFIKSKSNNKKKKREVKEDHMKFSDVRHKNCSGIGNWKKFLASQGMSLKVRTNSTNDSKLGILKTPHSNGNTPKITKVIGIDCEMVGTGERGEGNMLARVSLVNDFGDCIYDKYVKPREKVTDYRTQVSGIRPEDIKNAEEFEVVQREVADILKNRILVGHALKNDLDVLFLVHPKYATRDTSKFFCKSNNRTPSLKNLAQEYLQVAIQDGEHSSVIDARATMQLYNLYRKQWEMGKGNKAKRRIDNCTIEQQIQEQLNLHKLGSLEM